MYRLLAELFVAISGSQLAVVLIAPILVGEIHDARRAFLDASLLVVIGGPLIAWRMWAASRRMQFEGPVAPGEHSRQAARLTLMSVSVVVLVGLMLALGSVQRAMRTAEQEAELRFRQLAERMEAEAQRLADRPLYGLRGLRGLYMASEAVERGEFQRYFQARNFESEFPGVRHFGFIERVERQHLAAFVEAERASGAPGFTVIGATGDGPLYISTFSAPVAGDGDSPAHNFGADPVRRAAIERAIVTGEATMSGRLQRLDGGDPRSAVMFLMPVFRNGAAVSTGEERSRAIVGLLYATVEPEPILAGIRAAAGDRLDAALYDGIAPSEVESVVRGSKDRSAIRPIRACGRTWTLAVRSTGAFEQTVDHVTPVLVGAGGVLLTVMLAAIVWGIGTSRVRAVRMAERMTADLSSATRAAEAASRAKSEFLANMSHEIRTPLTAILGFTDLLREDGGFEGTPESRRQTVETIRRAGEHLLTVINDILDLSKIEADRMTVERMDCGLVGVVREVESLLRPRAVGKGVELRAELAGPFPERVMSDPTRVRQILMNLAGNAVKFTETGSVVLTVGAERVRGEERMVVDITDTGSGMTVEQAGRLFSAFGQADGTVTRRFGGTGLGLTISRRLANLMGGDVKLLWTTPGVGSCFRLALPLEPVAGTAIVSDLAAVRTKTEKAGSSGEIRLSGRVLLAEDGADNQRLIAFHLKRAGAEVAVAANGRIALEMIERAETMGQPYGMLLTDMQMPEMDGYTLARTLRARGSGMAIVALTAHAMAEDRTRCLEAGCDDYASKPIDKASLLATCRRWMGQPAGRVAAEAAGG